MFCQRLTPPDPSVTVHSDHEKADPEREIKQDPVLPRITGSLKRHQNDRHDHPSQTSSEIVG